MEMKFWIIICACTFQIVSGKAQNETLDASSVSITGPPPIEEEPESSDLNNRPVAVAVAPSEDLQPPPDTSFTPEEQYQYRHRPPPQSSYYQYNVPISGGYSGGYQSPPPPQTKIYGDEDDKRDEDDHDHDEDSSNKVEKEADDMDTASTIIIGRHSGRFVGPGAWIPIYNPWGQTRRYRQRWHRPSYRNHHRPRSGYFGPGIRIGNFG